jgi:DNA-binding PadR family transcriptional regulator
MSKRSRRRKRRGYHLNAKGRRYESLTRTLKQFTHKSRELTALFESVVEDTNQQTDRLYEKLKDVTTDDFLALFQDNRQTA